MTREQQLRATGPASRTVRPHLPQPETHTILEPVRPYGADRELACGCIPEYGHGPACHDRKAKR